MKSLALAAALALPASLAFGADKYVLDASHSQIVFSYNHLGYSTTFGMFSGFEGEIMFDQENPAASSVSVSMPAMSMFTGWEDRDAHLKSDDFFGVKDGDMISFTSTGIEVTGENTALITGDLTMNDVTKPVTLDATLNATGMHPMRKKDWAGFDATTTVLRSEFGLGKYTPFISDEVSVTISIEAMKAE